VVPDFLIPSFLNNYKIRIMFNRREFLKNSALLGSAAMFVGSQSVARAQKKYGANDILKVALVGCGGRGYAVIDSLEKVPQVKFVAFCDVDDKRASKAYQKYPAVPRFRDYRVMFDKLGDRIDAVAIATPDHMHYPIAAWAIANGKHVYCEKPLTRTIWEAEELKRLANDAGVITQMGNQGHTNEGWRLIKEWYEAGVLGQIEDIYIWTNRPIWPQGDLSVPPAEPIPATLDYKLWLGVAPYQPYNSAVLPFKWRGMRNYGTGAAGDMACHFLDVPYSAFDLGFPQEVVANSTPFNSYSWPSQASSIMTFDNDCGLDGKIRLHWFDGGRKPKSIKRVDDAFLKDPRNSNATFIVGTKETVYTNEYGVGTRIYPNARMKELAKSGALPQKKIARSIAPGNPHKEWALCCLEGKQPMGNFNYAAPFTEMALLGMVAICVPNMPLVYDPKTMSFLNYPKADKYIKSLYAYNDEFLPSRIRL